TIYSRDWSSDVCSSDLYQPHMQHTTFLFGSDFFSVDNAFSCGHQFMTSRFPILFIAFQNQAQGFKPCVWVCTAYGFSARKIQAVVHKQNKRVTVFVRYTLQYCHCTMSCSQNTIMPMVLGYF